MLRNRKLEKFLETFNFFAILYRKRKDEMKEREVTDRNCQNQIHQVTVDENMQQVKASKILFLFTKKIVWKDRSLKTVAKKSQFLLFFEPCLFLNRFYRREISKIKQAKNLWFSFLEKNSKDDDISEQLVTDLKCLLRSEVESNLRSHELTLNKTNSKPNHV